MTDMTDMHASSAAAALPETTSQPPFYVVGLRKFTTLFIATFGFYQVYWFYKNWRRFKDYVGPASTIWPVPRGIFSIFFVHALFRAIKQHAPDKAHVAAWNHSATATVFVILVIASNLLARMPVQSVDPYWLSVASLVMLIPTLFTLRQAQEMTNLACDDPAGASNAALTAANYVWIVLGGLVWLAVLFSMSGTGTYESTELGL